MNWINKLSRIKYRSTYKYREFVWNRQTSRKSPIELSCDCDLNFTFKTEGDITKILFCSQPFLNTHYAFEFETIKRFKQLAQKSETILDVGANIGLFSLIASAVNPRAKIHAFEPTPNTYRILKENIDLNKSKNITLHKLALSNTNGHVQMVSPKEAKLAGYDDSFNQISHTDSPSATTTRSQRLDEFVKENNIRKIDLIKADIEGAEKLLFEGGLETLKNDRPYIIFENYDPHCKSFNHNAKDVIDLLKTIGYKLNQFDEYQWIAE